MKLYLLCFFLLSSAFAKSVFDSMHEEWITYKRAFNKTYNNDEEEVKRFVIFISNTRKINVHNANHGHKFKVKMNKFGDLQPGEFVRAMNGFNRTFSANVHESNYIPGSSIPLPESVDWREGGAVTPVKDQGNCGSCWAFSTTGALEGQRHRIYEKLIPLSEQNLIDCSRRYGNEGCDGGLMDYAYRYIIDNKGIDTEKSYPYHSRQKICKYRPESKGASITGYINLPSGNETILQEAVALVGPISVAIDASHLSFQFYESGIYEEPNCNSKHLDHGLLVVGYGTKNDKDYWIVKNSWGTDWGENGYVLIHRNKNNHCGIATKASYPLI